MGRWCPRRCAAPAKGDPMLLRLRRAADNHLEPTACLNAGPWHNNG